MMRVSFRLASLAGILAVASQANAGFPYYFGAPDPLLSLDSFSHGSLYPNFNKFSFPSHKHSFKGYGDLVTFLPAAEGLRDDGSIAKFIKNYDSSRELSFNGKGFKVVPKANSGLPVIRLKGPEHEDILKGLEVQKDLKLDGPLIKEFQAEKASSELGALLGRNEKLTLKVPIVKGFDVGYVGPVSHAHHGFPIREPYGHVQSLAPIAVHKSVISLSKPIFSPELHDIKSGPTIIRNAGLVEIPAPQLHLSDHKFAPIIKKPSLFLGKHFAPQPVKIISPIGHERFEFQKDHISPIHAIPVHHDVHPVHVEKHVQHVAVRQPRQHTVAHHQEQNVHKEALQHDHHGNGGEQHHSGDLYHGDQNHHNQVHHHGDQNLHQQVHHHGDPHHQDQIHHHVGQQHGEHHHIQHHPGHHIGHQEGRHEPVSRLNLSLG
jgi:hypothetical protein